jgi:hypothetical protein
MAQQGKRYEPTDEDHLFVERAVMAGTTIEKIAESLDIHKDTLSKHFRYEIVTGRERMKGSAIRVLMDSLDDNSLDAAKYVLSRAAGWKEGSDLNVGGQEGNPLQITQSAVSPIEPIDMRPDEE